MDAEIQALERRAIAESDLTAWPILDAALRRAGLPARRVWLVWWHTGDYPAREDHVESVHYTKAGALAFMAALAAREGYTVDPDDPERYRELPSNYCGYLSLQWMEVEE